MAQAQLAFPNVASFLSAARRLRQAQLLNGSGAINNAGGIQALLQLMAVDAVGVATLAYEGAVKKLDDEASRGRAGLATGNHKTLTMNIQSLPPRQLKTYTMSFWTDPRLRYDGKQVFTMKVKEIREVAERELVTGAAKIARGEWLNALADECQKAKVASPDKLPTSVLSALQAQFP